MARPISVVEGGGQKREVQREAEVTQSCAKSCLAEQRDGLRRLREDPLSSLKRKLKTQLLRLSYWIAYHAAAPSVYSRQPFVRYPYMYSPSEIIELTQQLLSVTVAGPAVEIGCNQGWTTCFLLEALLEKGIQREYFCMDTFSGFMREDVTLEYAWRGQPPGIYDDLFVLNDLKWLRASLKRFGYSNARLIKADAKTFDYGVFGKIAFALIDLDLYRPVRESLKRILSHMAQGGVIIVDDCDNGSDIRWNGAYQAFMEFCQEQRFRPEILCGKLGIIHT